MPPETTTPGTGDSTGATPPQAGQNAGAAQNAAADMTPRFTQADIDRAVSERLTRERKQAEERAAKDRTAAEQKALAENNEFKTIAEQRLAELDKVQPQLETLTARHTALAERLNKQIDTGMKDWPAEARRMVPPGDDVAARLDAYENMRGLIEKGTLAPRQPGNSAGPRPASGAPDAAKRVEADLRATGRYTGI